MLPVLISDINTCTDTNGPSVKRPNRWLDMRVSSRLPTGPAPFWSCCASTRRGIRRVWPRCSFKTTQLLGVANGERYMKALPPTVQLICYRENCGSSGRTVLKVALRSTCVECKADVRNQHHLRQSSHDVVQYQQRWPFQPDLASFSCRLPLNIQCCLCTVRGRGGFDID